MIHQPVLVEQVVKIFKPGPDDILLDLTLGHGGHTRAFLKAAGPGAKATGFDADPQAIAIAQRQLLEFRGQVTFVNQNFAHLNDALMGGGIVEPPDTKYSHILFDLGVGSHQLSDSSRGFSFQHGGRLQMAYGVLRALPEADFMPLNQLTEFLRHYPDAGDIIRHLAVRDLADLIRTYGEERYAGRIATALKAQLAPYSAQDIAGAISRAVPARSATGRLHPATRTFQALRLAVNRELECLQTALPQALAQLRPAGCLAVISFHSLEDRIVKRYFKSEQKLAILTKKVIRASAEEIKRNPRSRSAKLRAATKKMK